MSLQIRYAPWFDADVQFRMAWYSQRSGPNLASRFIGAVEATVGKLVANPFRGHRPYPKDVDLADIRVIRVARPFQKYLLFHRVTTEALMLERLIYGGRDLPRRLRESPYESD